MNDDLRPEYQFDYRQAKANRLAEGQERVAGKRVRRTRLIQTDQYVVAVEVEMVIPLDEPGVPCLEAEAVSFLREVRERAEWGDVAWLLKHGKVYAAVAGA